MEKYTRLSLRLQIRSFKNTFFQFNGLPFKGLLNDNLIETIHKSGNSRDTVFSPLITLRAFLFQVLSPTGSCKEAVAHVLIERIGSNCSENTMNTWPYCKARLRLSLSHLKETVRSSGEKLHQCASNDWLWKGYRVMLVDGTTVVMPDTGNNQETYPQQSVQKPGLGFPIVRLVGLLSLATGSCVDYALGSFQGKGSGETSLFSQLIESLGTSDLLLADRFYTTYAIMALLLEQGTPMVFRQRSNVKRDFRRGQRLGAKDHIISVKKPKRRPVWMLDSRWAELPDEIFVREFSVDGVVYVSSLSDSKKYPRNSLAQLYHQRWKVELDFRTIKTHMGMEMLRCKTADMVNKEIPVHLLAYNLIRANLSRAACLNDKKPRYLSFMAAVQLMRNTASLCITLSGTMLEKLILPLLAAMTETEIGNRTRPNQPRVIKRRPKAYPMMTKPRDEYVTL